MDNQPLVPPVEKQGTSSMSDLMPPRYGMSRGTLQGLGVVFALLIVLFVVLNFSVRPDHKSTLRSADLLAAIIVAVTGVWVVGGMFSLGSAIKDVGIKAVGGVAVIFALLYMEPFSRSEDNVSFDYSTDVPFDGNIGDILQIAQREMSNLAIPSESLDKLLDFNPLTIDGNALQLHANEPKAWDVDRTPAIEKVLREIVFRSSSCLSLAGPDAKGKLTLLLHETKVREDRSKNGVRKIFRCIS